MAVQPAELIKSDQDHLIHPLHHPSDHLEPMVYVKGRGATITDIQGREYIDGLAGLWNIERGARARGAGQGGRHADGRAGLLLGLRRLVQHPGRRAGGEAHLDLVPEHAGRLLHLRRGGVQRVRVQDGAVLLEGQGQARQGQDHRAPARVPRRDPAGDERHRHVALLEDVRAARAQLRPHSRPATPTGRRAPSPARRRGRPRRACSRRRSCARGPTRWRPSSPSPFTAGAACSIPPTTTSRSCARSATSTRCCSSRDEVITGFCRTGHWFALDALERAARHHVLRQGRVVGLSAARRHHGVQGRSRRPWTR